MTGCSKELTIRKKGIEHLQPRRGILQGWDNNISKKMHGRNVLTKKVGSSIITPRQGKRRGIPRSRDNSSKKTHGRNMRTNKVGSSIITP